MPATSESPEQGNGVPGAPPELEPGMRWRRVFPGDERQLGLLRRWLASLLPDGPARDDLATVATELASNAIRHTASGRGGWFAAEITWHAPMVRVAVADCGGPTEPQVIEDVAAEHGRGLLLVRGLSVRTGTCGDRRGRLVWADVRWDGAAPVVPAAGGDPYQAAIRDGEAALARRFARVPAWFGRSTLQWWALPESGGLVSAPSARELAALLCRLPDARHPQSSPAPAQSYEGVGERHGVRPDREPDGPLRRAEPGTHPRMSGGTGRPGGHDSRGNSRGTPGGNPSRGRALSGHPRPALVPAPLTSGAA